LQSSSACSALPLEDDLVVVDDVEAVGDARRIKQLRFCDEAGDSEDLDLEDRFTTTGTSPSNVASSALAAQQTRAARKTLQHLFLDVPVGG